MVTLLPNRSVLARPRHAVASVVIPTPGGNWRPGSAVSGFGGTTGLFTGACASYVNGAMGIQTAAKHTAKRPARHLGTRST